MSVSFPGHGCKATKWAQGLADSLYAKMSPADKERASRDIGDRGLPETRLAVLVSTHLSSDKDKMWLCPSKDCEKAFKNRLFKLAYDEFYRVSPQRR